MEYSQLGKFGVKVSRICLGSAFRCQTDDAVCERIVHRALELGCNFIDSANFYGVGRSEEIVGRALRGKRDDVVITSKVFSPIGPGPNDRGLSRFHIMREVERSLKRLQTDRMDIYLQHSFDSTTPAEEILRAMDDLVRQGKVIYTGSCNHAPWRLMEQLGICRAEGLAPLTVTQHPYNLLQRHQVEGDLMDLVDEYGLGLMTYSPLAVGLLSGEFRRGEVPAAGTPWTERREDMDSYMTDRVQAIIDKLVEIATRIGKTPQQTAVAWILDHPQVTAAMMGPDTPEQVDDVMSGTGWQLEPTDRQALDAISQIDQPCHIG